MFVEALSIANLRNVGAADLQPHPRLNVLHGANGAGKSTVIEALVLLAKGRSFRGGTTASLIGPLADRFRVVAALRTGEGAGNHRLGLERSKSEWQARIDGADARQLSDLAERLPLVLLEPNSHSLISGAPDIRRRYLDWSVFHVKHGFLEHWRRYTRALKQRNAALKSRQWALVSSLDPLLAAHGTAIHGARAAFFERLLDVLPITLGELSPRMGAVELRYEPGWKGGDLGEVLASSSGRERELGQTLHGPHRAELSIRANGTLARDRLSRGEQKILAAALLLSQAKLLAEAGRLPLLLLDDLASEFDQQHLERVVYTGLALQSQLWITGTVATPYVAFSADSRGVFHVEQGAITKGGASPD